MQLWGLGESRHVLHLPECTGLSLYRADDLDWIEVHAPKLHRLNLQACYSCEHVRLYPEDGPAVDNNLVNANIGSSSMYHLQQHPRVGRQCMQVSEDEDFGAMLGDYPAPNMEAMMGGAIAELFANIMGAPGAHGGDHDANDEDYDEEAESDEDDYDEDDDYSEVDESDEGIEHEADRQAPSVEEMLALVQQATLHGHLGTGCMHS